MKKLEGFDNGVKPNEGLHSKRVCKCPASNSRVHSMLNARCYTRNLGTKLGIVKKWTFPIMESSNE